MSIVPADAQAIARAAQCLRQGALVALPTETVYGLGADAGNREAVAAVYRTKGRPADHPLIVHTADLAGAQRWAHFDDQALALARAHWPGPLTLILNRLPEAPDFACAGQATIGLRVPAHPVALALLEAFGALGGQGIAAPSANRFGRVSPTRAEHVLADLGDAVPMILDGGDCGVGLESTIIDLSRGRPVLLRPGGLAVADIARTLGERPQARDAQAPRASGTLAAHYAPRTPVELVAAGELAARMAHWQARGQRSALWPAPADTPQAAQHYAHVLYDQLRRLDAQDAQRILIECPPTGPDWEAIHDRLGRAAAAFDEDSP